MSEPVTGTKSKVAGIKHPDTKQFDDLTELLSKRSNVRLTQLHVLHDQKRIHGINTFYEADSVALHGLHGP